MYSLHSNEIGALVFHIFSLNKNIDIKILLESVFNTNSHFYFWYNFVFFYDMYGI
jgi:hypothetical protein